MNRAAIFRELSEDQMGLLGPLFEAFSCHAGSVILQQGTQAEFLYLIISGKVEVSFKPYDGKMLVRVSNPFLCRVCRSNLRY